METEQSVKYLCRNQSEWDTAVDLFKKAGYNWRKFDNFNPTHLVFPRVVHIEHGYIVYAYDASIVAAYETVIPVNRHKILQLIKQYNEIHSKE